MTQFHTSVEHTAARGALVVGAAWLDSMANLRFAPVFTGAIFSVD